MSTRFRDFFEKSVHDRELRKTAAQDTRDILSEALVEPPKLGHPEFEALRNGEQRNSNCVVFFADIRGFTKLSLVLENNELLEMLQDMTSAAVRAILAAGGYIGEFTGDGVMAYFGDSTKSYETAAMSALSTAGDLLQGVQDVVNPRLLKKGLEPIRVAIGMEYGPVLWARIGLSHVSQVKPISDVTFLAGKLATSDQTKAWECKVGERLAAWIPEDFRQKADPYKFQHNHREISHDLFLFKWDTFLKMQQAQPGQLNQRFAGKRLGALPVLSASAVVQPDPLGRTGPRALKDQPFF